MSTFTMDGYLAQLHQGLFAYFYLRKLSYNYSFFRRMNHFKSRKLLQIEIIKRIISHNAHGEYLIDTG